MTEPTRTQAEIVAGLLGPAGAELTCEACFDQLDVYVDSELSGEDADARVPGMREHLAGCPACAEEHISLRDLLSGTHR
jgi:anti-sigma factor RsiW